MNRLRKAISKMLDAVLEPMLCRIEDRIRSSFQSLIDDPRRPSFASLHQRLETMERALVRPFLSTVIKNEMQNIDALPLPLLKSMTELTVVTYFAEDLESILPGCRATPIADWLWAKEPIHFRSHLGNLLFMDEYYFIRAMERLSPPVFLVAESVIFATRFDYITETRCRAILHQLGFMEIILVSVDGLTGDLATFAISHPSPVTCDPIFVDERRPSTEFNRSAIWLVARKVAEYGYEEWPRV